MQGIPESQSKSKSPDEQFYKFSSENLGRKTSLDLYQILKTLRLYERVVVPPFESILQIKDLLSFAGKEFEIGLDYLVHPSQENHGKKYDFEAVIALEDGQNLVGSLYRPNIKKSLNEVRENAIIITFNESRLFEIFSQIGLIGNRMGIVTLTKGTENSVLHKISFPHFSAHSHPAGSRAHPGYVDLGSAYNALLDATNVVPLSLPEANSTSLASRLIKKLMPK